MTSPSRLMRLLSSPSRLARTHNAVASAARAATSPAAACSNPRSCLASCRCLAQVTDLGSGGGGREIWFTSAAPRLSPPFPGASNLDHRPPDQRTLQLGKTVRTLHERLPSILQSPLPSEILSPQITLHLFPSTHPHLPTVSGRIPYNAALRTAPVAWGRVPFVGNGIEILSERMVRNGGPYTPPAPSEDTQAEKLIVKWRTKRGRSLEGALDSSKPAGDDETFTALFVFSFDTEGRVVRHVIEHTEEGGQWDRMTRVVSVTDWLIGRFNGKGGKEAVPELALCEERADGNRIRLVDRRGRVDGL